MDDNGHSFSGSVDDDENLKNNACLKSNIEIPTFTETVEISTSEHIVIADDNHETTNHKVIAEDCEFNSLNKIEASSPLQVIKIRSRQQAEACLKSIFDQVVCNKTADTVEVKSENVTSTDLSLENTDLEGYSDEIESLKQEQSISLVTYETADYRLSNYYIDYDNIAKFVLCEPVIEYSYGEITLKCTKKNKKIFTKKFVCSTLGLGDKEVLSKIQAYINSYEIIRHLAVLGKLDYSNIADLISKDIKLSRLSDEHIRLVLTLHNGRTISKIFPGSELGIKDPVTRKVIQDYVDSDEGRQWVMDGVKRSSGKGSWKKVGEVSTGGDTMKFITNTIKFDVKQRFLYEKRVLDIIRDEDVLPASSSSHTTWGSAHRSDDRFALKVPSKTVGSNVAARFFLECASLTNKCKTKCGIPINDVTIVNGKFSCCGQIRQSQSCFNCLINNSSQWYTIENGSVICNSCYKYFQRRGVHRPYCRKNKRKERIHEIHTKCDWKMKLELRSNDVTKWNIYEHTNNDKDHNIKVPSHTRPTLPIRDKWDKLRMLAKLTPKQILTSEKQLRNNTPDIQSKRSNKVLHAIRTRANVIDNRKKNASITVKDGIPIATQWKGSRITIEKYFEHMVFLQKEHKGESKKHHLVICPADNIENLRDLDIPVEGYLEQAKFKNGIIIVYYDSYEGVAVAFLISSIENGIGLVISHELTFRIVEADGEWTSILHHEKHSENRCDFLPTSDKLSLGPRKYISKQDSVFDYDGIADLISEKPRISKISAKRIRLTCSLSDGKTLTKTFPSSNLGAHDPEAVKSIQQFLSSGECRTWLENRGNNVWGKIGELSTGTDTEEYLQHIIDFEVTQRFYYHKNILSIVNDSDKKQTTLRKHGKNGSNINQKSEFHRVGYKFCLKVPQDGLGNKLLATLYIDCSSTSKVCKTKCGVLTKDVIVVDGMFSCCKTPREQGNICCNCLTDNSDRWILIEQENFLCHTCHNYYKKTNEHRPTSLSKTKRKKIHDNHVKCNWKLKLELRASDITRWQVFKNYKNKEAHSDVTGDIPSNQKR
ncbi:hypothetical protein SK128_013563, partial [Halocaridina rubra]